MQDRRLGKDPVTKHRPHDFLHPGWSDDSDGEAAEDRCDDLRPLPASADKLQDCSAEQALMWLQCVACNPLERPKVTPLHPALAALHAHYTQHAVHAYHAARQKANFTPLHTVSPLRVGLVIGGVPICRPFAALHATLYIAC